MQNLARQFSKADKLDKINGKVGVSTGRRIKP